MNFHALAIVGVFIILDVCSGLIKAAASKDFSSNKLRKGAYHKATFLLITIMAYCCDYAVGYIDLGIPSVITPCVAAYLVITEIASILENVGEITPELKSSKLLGFFSITNEDNDDAGM